jgi:uncharacterized protein
VLRQTGGVSTDASQVRVSRNEDESRYEAWVGDELAGFAAYSLDEDHIVFTHTEVDDRFEGQGVGSALARGALDEVREHETRRVVARCPFIRRWIDLHPDYRDLTRR